jgi:hypothetical protein
VRDERRDAAQRCLLVGELCQRFARLCVCDRRREQLSELGETGSGVFGEPFRVGRDDRSPYASGHHDRDADSGTNAAASNGVSDLALELGVVVDACWFGVLPYQAEYVGALERYARPRVEWRRLRRERTAHCRSGIGLVAGHGDGRRVDDAADLLGDDAKEHVGLRALGNKHGNATQRSLLECGFGALFHVAGRVSDHRSLGQYHAAGGMALNAAALNDPGAEPGSGRPAAAYAVDSSSVSYSGGLRRARRRAGRSRPSVPGR